LIFARHRNQMRSGSNVATGSFLTAWAIDNGMCFGKDWTFIERACYGSPRPLGFHSHCNLNLKEFAHKGAALIHSLPESELYAACQHIPSNWRVAGDERALESMLRALQKRQQGMEESIHFYLARAKTYETLAS
jgi:hypothetical protein